MKNVNKFSYIKNQKGVNQMPEKLFLTVEDVASELNISQSFAYKLMREMNKELKQMGYFTIAGRVDRKFFYEKFYCTQQEDKRG